MDPRNCWLAQRTQGQQQGQAGQARQAVASTRRSWIPGFCACVCRLRAAYLGLWRTTIICQPTESLNFWCSHLSKRLVRHQTACKSNHTRLNLALGYLHCNPLLRMAIDGHALSAIQSRAFRFSISVFLAFTGGVASWFASNLSLRFARKVGFEVGRGVDTNLSSIHWGVACWNWRVSYNGPMAHMIHVVSATSMVVLHSGL